MDWWSPCRYRFQPLFRIASLNCDLRVLYCACIRPRLNYDVTARCIACTLYCRDIITLNHLKQCHVFTLYCFSQGRLDRPTVIGPTTHWSEKNTVVRRPIGPKNHWSEDPLVRKCHWSENHWSEKVCRWSEKPNGPKKCHWSENSGSKGRGVF